MISAAISMSRIAIQDRPRAPLVIFLATIALMVTKTKQTKYATQALVSAPVTVKPKNVRSGALIWPDAE